MRVKRLLEKMSISENSGVCVALFFTSDKQGNNSSSKATNFDVYAVL